MTESSPRSLAQPPPDLIAYIDGGARGNPGPAGFGVVLKDARGRTLETISRPIGKATNNVAEYRALLAALEYAAGKHVRRLKILCDSELVVRQMQGRYRVLSPDLKPLYQRARELAAGLERFAIEHVPREENSLADRLANEAMDAGESPPASPAAAFHAIAEGGRLRPVPPAPRLEEGAEYEVRIRKRTGKQDSPSR